MNNNQESAAYLHALSTLILNSTIIKKADGIDLYTLLERTSRNTDALKHYSSDIIAISERFNVSCESILDDLFKLVDLSKLF